MSKQSIFRTPLIAGFGLAAVLATAPAALAAQVAPVYEPGNPDCASLGLESIYKFEPVMNDDQAGIKLTVDGDYVSFTSVDPVDAVIVKGGNNSNVYEYVNDTSADSGLSAPDNNGKPFGLSHVEFCTDGNDDSLPPADEPPADEPPADEPPADEPPADTTPADTTPADTTPADTTPADTTPAATTPAATTPAATTPAATTPASGAVLGESIASGTARLSGKSGCVKQAFRARVSGRSIASVGFYVDGKLVKKFNSSRAQYSITVKPGRLGFGRHKVIARVTFASGSGTGVRSLAMTFRRCAKAAVAPSFTG